MVYYGILRYVKVYSGIAVIAGAEGTLTEKEAHVLATCFPEPACTQPEPCVSCKNQAEVRKTQGLSRLARTCPLCKQRLSRLTGPGFLYLEVWGFGSSGLH